MGRDGRDGNGGRTILVGDVHGCAEELAELLVLLDPTPPDRVLLLGDLFDRGPDPEGVLDLVLGRELEVIRGNHDDLLLRRLRAEDRGEDPPDLGPTQAACLEALAPRHDDLLDLLRTAPVARATDDWIAVHGGIHPDRGLHGTPVDQLLNLRRLEDRPGEPYWWEAWPADGRLVVFGHVASREGISRRTDDRRLICGVDTGCVYGLRLTAYIVEEDALASVPARDAYCEAISVPERRVG